MDGHETSKCLANAYKYPFTFLKPSLAFMHSLNGSIGSDPNILADNLTNIGSKNWLKILASNLNPYKM